MGSNVGDRLEALTSCLFVLDDTDGITVHDVSGVYETAPWGEVEQEPYLNAVVRVDTDLDAHALLAELQATEAAFGRDRSREERWGPRTLDLDLLLFGEQVIDTPDLQVPHPRITERAFVLVPLLELMPGGALPGGTRLTQAVAALAPLEGIDLFVRLSDVPGTAHRTTRPEGPGSPGAILARDWTPPRGAPEGTER